MNLFCLSTVLIALSLHTVSTKPSLKAAVEEYEIGIPRIIGGIDSTPGQFPYVLSLEYFGATGWVHICGMSLINSWHGLTSARCVNNINTVNLRAYAGIYTRQNYTSTNAQQIMFNQLTVHPNFDIFTPGSLGDIAVVRFSWQADTSRPDVAFIALPPDDSNLFLNPSCTTVGWGRYDTTQAFSWNQQYVQLPTITNQECSDALIHVNAYIDDTVICTLDAGGIGPCSGDAGGPLVCAPNPGDTSPLYLVGVVSYTTMRNQMCDEFTPVVYTRTSKYLEWIANVTSTTF